MVSKRLRTVLVALYPVALVVSLALLIGWKLHTEKAHAQRLVDQRAEAERFFELGMYEEALKLFKGLDVKEENPEMQHKLIDIYQALRQPEMLERTAMRLIQKEAQPAILYEKMARAWEDAREYANAYRALEMGKDATKADSFDSELRRLQSLYSLHRLSAEQIDSFEESPFYVKAKDEDGWFVMDDAGKNRFAKTRVEEVIAMISTEGNQQPEFLVQKHGQKYVSTITGKFVQWVESDVASSLDEESEGALHPILIPFEQESRWGVKNRDGEVVVAPQFDEMLSISKRGATYVRQNQTWYLMTFDAFWKRT